MARKAEQDEERWRQRSGEGAGGVTPSRDAATDDAEAESGDRYNDWARGLGGGNAGNAGGGEYAEAGEEGAAGGADYNAHPYYNEGNTTPAAGNTANDVTIEAAKETPASTTAGAGEEGAAGGEAGGEAGGGGYAAPTPERGGRYSGMVGPYKQPYSDEELRKAQKKGRRESRMATAGHIMDTLARVLNYAATTQGAPSAKWSNRNREVDRNAYYTMLKGENDKARQNYWNMALSAGKADNDEYKADVDLYDKQMKYKDKDAERKQKQPQIEADVAEKNAKAEKARVEAEWQKIANENEPEALRLKNEALKAQTANSYASANAHNAKAAEARSGGKTNDDMYLPQIGEDGEPVKDENGNIKFEKYTDAAVYNKVRAYLNDKYEFDDREYKESGFLQNREHTSKTLSNKDYATSIAKAIYDSEGGSEGEREGSAFGK